WRNEIVVVTGGSHGVGLELAKRLLKAGARVAILDVNPFPINDIKYADKWRYYKCDITNLEQTKNTADQIRADLGNPTMLVNNAGIVVGKLLLEMADAEVDKVINVNLTSHFHLIRQFLPAMLEARRGHIVTVGSIVSFVGTPQASTYCASKGGVKLLHESLRREVASRYRSSNIQFSIAYPGVIDSGLFRGLDLGQFFMPTLRPDAIAREIFSALGSGRGREIFLPKFANVIPLLYAFSQDARTRLINAVSGGDTAMANFSG
ncbi:NAD(P)-binding protein, partial [Martensiomyces pterosporus]